MALKKKTVNIGKEGIPSTISQIAKKFGTTVKAIKQANPKIANVNKVRLGQSLVIPSPKTTGTSNDPYKGMTLKQMADMDVKNKDMKRQKRVTRDIGARGMNTTSAGKAATKSKKKTMALPKPKPKTEIAKKKRVSDRLAALGKKADEKTKTTKKMSLPKPKPKSKAKPKKELTAVQKKSRAFFSKLGKELMRKGPKSRTS